MAGLAAAYRLQQASAERPLTIHLVDAAPRFGGKVVSEAHDGFLLEGGPDSFIAHKPSALQLARELGLEERLLACNEGPGGASIFHGDRLQPLPDGFRQLVPGRWGPFLRSPLLSWRGKLRLACEPWVPRGRQDEDESVGAFIRRRLGPEALERLAEPMLAHIHVADIERMSLLSTYPRLHALEQRHGSLWRGLRSAPRPRGPLFWTLQGGVAELCDRLVERLPDVHKHQGSTVREVTSQADGTYQVHLDDMTLTADTVVLAVPAFAAASILQRSAPALAQALGAIRYVSLATLSLGFCRQDIPNHVSGFGFFVPRGAQRQVLAATWSSAKFAHRAPVDRVLLRVFLANKDVDEDVLGLSDDALMTAVRQDLERLVGLRAEPLFGRLYRWPRGYPQYDVGHGSVLKRIEEQLPERIFLAGSAFHGVGLPDCIQSGFAAADAVLEVSE